MSFTSFVKLETLSCNYEFCKSILSSVLSIPARFTSAVGLFEAVGFDMFVCYRCRCKRSEAQTRPTSTDTCARIDSIQPIQPIAKILKTKISLDSANCKILKTKIHGFARINESNPLALESFFMTGYVKYH